MNFGFNEKNSNERQKTIEDLKVEESEGLNKFYNKIVTPEILDRNFGRWYEHLYKLLIDKYSDSGSLDFVMGRAKEYVEKIPLVHSTSYENIRNSSTPNISSSFMINGLEGEMRGAGTTGFDREKELDHFVYCHVGIIANRHGGFGDGWDTQVYLDNKALQEVGVVVSLEDYAMTGHRLQQQKHKNFFREETQFNIQLQQIWRGSDFSVLLVMMLAYAYDNLDDFEREKPFPEELIPEGFPRLVTQDNSLGYLSGRLIPDFPHFEVRIPRTILPEDIIAFFVNENSIGKSGYTGSKVFIIPSSLSAEDKRNFIKDKIISKLL